MKGRLLYYYIIHWTRHLGMKWYQRFVGGRIDIPGHRSTAKFVWSQLVCMTFLVDLCCDIEGKSPLKKSLNFDGPCRQEIIGQPFPMNGSKTGHSYEAFTYLFGQNIFILLLSANKNSPVDLSKFVITGNCGLIRDSVVGLRLFISPTVLLCTIVSPVFFCSISILRALVTQEPIEWETSGFQRKFCLIAAFLINYRSLSS